MENIISLFVADSQGEKQKIEVPTDMGLSVMEVLKANELEIQAMCGGMAICATCHVEVLEGDDLPEPSEDETYMLESLPHATSKSRLSCQLRISSAMDGLVVRIMPEA